MALTTAGAVGAALGAFIAIGLLFGKMMGRWP
jgi:hypothetical protein